MRRVRMTLVHIVPGWNFCQFEESNLCRFCDKTKKGYVCRLYDTNLMSNGLDIYKCEGCKRASAGYDTIVEDNVPAPIAPDQKLVMSAAIEMYRKSLNELLGQGYPRVLAEKLAQQAVLGGK